MSIPINCFEYGIFDLETDYQKEIDEINNSFGKKVFKLIYSQNDRIFLKATQHVGLINIKGRIIQILPKTYHRDEECPEEKRKQAIKNLFYMLNHTSFKLKDWDATAFEKFDDIFEVIIYLFSKNLLDIVKKGFYRNYITIEENKSGALRGKLLVHKHATENFITKQKFYIEFDEFSENNLLNHVFKFTIEHLSYLSTNDINKKLLRELKFLFSDVDYQFITDSDLNRITFSKLNDHYKQPFNMAKMFIQRIWYPEYLMAPKAKDIYGFLIDMNQLFQDFLAYFIKKYKTDILPEQYRHAEILIQKSEMYLVSDEKRNGVFELKPDIMIKEGKDFKLIIDAKYKELKPDERKLGISQGDMYQVYAYTTRYNSPKTILVYPEYENYMNPIIREFYSDSKKISARSINLMMDLSKNEEELKKCLKEILA